MKLTAPPPPSSVPNTTHSPPVRTRMEIFPEDFDLWLSSVLYFPPACVPLIRTVFFYSQPRPQLRACVHCFECLLPRLQNRPALKPKELHKGRSKRSLVSAQLPMLPVWAAATWTVITREILVVPCFPPSFTEAAISRACRNSWQGGKVVKTFRLRTSPYKASQEVSIWELFCNWEWSGLLHLPASTVKIPCL